MRTKLWRDSLENEAGILVISGPIFGRGHLVCTNTRRVAYS